MGRPLKILYLRSENTAGTLQLFVDAHRKLGNEAHFVTLFPTAEGFPEDICLDLPLLPKTVPFKKVKSLISNESKLYKEAQGYPPQWKPSLNRALFFTLRDQLWKPLLKRFFKEHHLLDYDIYHLEGGHGFLRTSAWPFDELKKQGKHIIANYHGVDMRTRGVFPWIDKLVDINTTSELDLIEKHPKIEYVFLPFEVEKFTPHFELNQPLKICHATRDRYWKGSDVIIEACKKLEKSHGIEFVLIENEPHEITLQKKAACDIYIDQVANLGGWGYGMNSVESFSMGLACCTNLIPEYETFLGEHPFVNVHKDSLYEDLVKLIPDKELIIQKKKAGRAWVEKTHSVEAVMRSVYDIYLKQGWIKELPRDLA
ncbi:MAG: hypothetical protein K9M55_04450 [Candidatus Marinimicrobia bacterium]|nr:hypothetical protein [Candidatus Neomarinimicrobiota bacterium]MCF7921933.1 hypothetical protein [Candidatus Neomarinimicrobiota bacterium]